MHPQSQDDPDAYFDPNNLEINDESYNNPNVMEIRNELGPFHFTTVDRDGKERAKRPIIMLENGAKYEGEW